MAVGKGSILRAENANATVKGQTGHTVDKEPVLAETVVKDGAFAVPIKELKAVPKAWGQVWLDEARIEKLAESLREYGMICPVMAYQNDKGTLLTLKGTHRVAAAKKAGMNDVPVCFVQAKDEREARKYYEQLHAFDDKHRLTENEAQHYEIISAVKSTMPDYLL